MSNAYRAVVSAGGGAPTGNAQPSEVISGKTFENSNGPQTGTMPDNGAVSETLEAGESYTVPEGYHNGSGSVSAVGLTDGHYKLCNNTNGGGVSTVQEGAYTNTISWSTSYTAFIINVKSKSTVSSSSQYVNMIGFTDDGNATALALTGSIDISRYTYLLGSTGAAATLTFT